MPLVIDSASVEKTLLIPRDRGAAEKAEFARRMHSLVRDLGFLQSFHALGVDEINNLTQEKRYEEAFARAKQLSRDLQAMFGPAQLLSKQLQQEAEKLKLDASKRFAGISESFGKMEANVATVETLEANLTKVIEANNQRARADVAIDLGKASEQSGDFEEAIANYQQALAELPDQKAVAQRLEQLKEAWRIKSPAHQKARKFVYETWTSLDISRLDGVMPEAKDAIETMVAVNDYLAAQKFLVTIDSFVEEYDGVAAQLIDSENPDDVADMTEIKHHMEQLAELSKLLEQIKQPEPVEAEASSPSP